MSNENAQSPRKGEVEIPGIAAAIAEIERRNAPRHVGEIIQDVARRFDAASAHYAGSTPEQAFDAQEEEK